MTKSSDLFPGAALLAFDAFCGVKLAEVQAIIQIRGETGAHQALCICLFVATKGTASDPYLASIAFLPFFV